jgi:hypothetical protein
MSFKFGGGDQLQITATTFVSTQTMLTDGWLLAKGVTGDDERFDAPPEVEIPGAGGAIGWINARGGVRRLTSVLAAAPTYIHNNSIDWISLQDAPRQYQRWAVQQWNAGVPDAYSIVGWQNWGGTDTVGIQADAAVPGGNYTIRAQRAGATTIHDTGIAAVIGEYHIWEMVSTTAGVVTIYHAGTLVHTLAAAETPAPATLMETWQYTRPVAPAILSNLDVDVCKSVMSRNTAVTP